MIVCDFTRILKMNIDSDFSLFLCCLFACLAALFHPLFFHWDRQYGDWKKNIHKISPRNIHLWITRYRDKVHGLSVCLSVFHCCSFTVYKSCSNVPHTDQIHIHPVKIVKVNPAGQLRETWYIPCVSQCSSSHTESKIKLKSHNQRWEKRHRMQKQTLNKTGLWWRRYLTVWSEPAVIYSGLWPHRLFWPARSPVRTWSGDSSPPLVWSAECWALSSTR